MSLGDIANRKTMVIRANRLGVGIDVGWQFEGGFTLWPMNVTDGAALGALIEDLEQRGQVFDISPEVAAATKEGEGE